MKKSLLFISALIIGAIGSAQSIPNGNLENWTNATSPANWSKEWVMTGLVNAVKSTTDLVAGYVGASAIQIHSAQVSGPSYAPGIAISGANASTKMVITSLGAGGQTIYIYGSIPATVRPLTLSGFAKYRSTGSNHGVIGVEVFDQGNIVGNYATGEFVLDPSVTWVNFNIPLTYTNTATTVDSIRITLGTSRALSTPAETPTAGDTLVVDMLRFFSCTIDPTVTLNAPSVISDDGMAGLSAEGILTLPGCFLAHNYNHTFTFSIPNPLISTLAAQSAEVSYTISPLDSVVFGDVTTIPGLIFTQGTPGGVAYPNSLYCYSISGTIPATNNIAYQMNIVQTPYGIIHAVIPALSIDLGSTTAPIGSLTTPIGAQAIDFRNLAIDSVIIQSQICEGIADFTSSGGLSVSQNIPNPFDASTTINFNCSVSENVTFVVTDVLGRQVYDTNINTTAGSNTFTYSTDLANGIYFFSISDRTNTTTRTMVIAE